MNDGVTRVMLATRLDAGVQLNDTYEIDERIASGGMGEVYRGHNIQTAEPVAIKTILPEFADQEAIFALFKREATILGRLHHDTIVRYYSFSRDPRLGRPYLAMEFVEGVSLADRMKEKPLDVDEACRLFASVAEGLALAHGAGVIHRDLSPDNIILRDGDVGRPKIIDFGIARSANVGEGTLIGGGFAGKYNFISPEQLGIHGREVDARSDIYSLGLVLAAALRGRPLEMGGSHVDVIEKRTRLPDLSDIDEALRPLVTAMLQPNPDDRPEGAARVAEWLRAARLPAPAESARIVPPAAAHPAQAGVPWTAVPAGLGGAGAEPTQVTTGPRSQSPFSVPPQAPPTAPTPAAHASESPFGPASAYPNSQPLQGAPALAGSVEPPAPARQRGAGRFVAAGIVALALAGAGGAYMTGLIGPTGKPAGDATTAQTPASNEAKEPEAKPATDGGTVASAPETQQSTAKSPEHEAIGQALEEVARAEQGVTGEQPGQPPVDQASTDQTERVAKAEEPGAGTGPEQVPGTVQSDIGSAASGNSTEPAADTSQPEAKPLAVPEDGSSSEQGGTAADTTADQGAAENPPAEDAIKETQQAAAGLTKMMDVSVAWLHQYDGGKCFFVAVTSVSDKTINIKGFGRDIASFQKLYDGFMEANQIEPELNGHLINEAQCAAAEFLKKVQPTARDNPQITLAVDRVKVGDTLSVDVDSSPDKVLDLLLIDGDGLVYNVKDFAAETINDGRRNFQLWLGGFHLIEESPLMLVALTSETGLTVPKGKEHARATALFLKLDKQIKEKGGDIGVDFAYFRASP